MHECYRQGTKTHKAAQNRQTLMEDILSHHISVGFSSKMKNSIETDSRTKIKVQLACEHRIIEKCYQRAVETDSKQVKPNCVFYKQESRAFCPANSCTSKATTLMLQEQEKNYCGRATKEFFSFRLFFGVAE